MFSILREIIFETFWTDTKCHKPSHFKNILLTIYLETLLALPNSPELLTQSPREILFQLQIHWTEKEVSSLQSWKRLISQKNWHNGSNTIIHGSQGQYYWTDNFGHLFLISRKRHQMKTRAGDIHKITICRPLNGAVGQYVNKNKKNSRSAIFVFCLTENFISYSIIRDERRPSP